MSREVSGPLLHYADGVAGFEHPCADYLYVYDEDDDNVIDEEDCSSGASEERSKCPHLHARRQGRDGTGVRACG